MVSTADFTIGSVVRARGREWVVVPGDDDPDILTIRPLGGNDDDVTGILHKIEHVEPATFPLPDPTDSRDYLSARMLLDAVRLNIRAGAGPFRSFGRIAVEPRPYQLVPLLMALRLDPVRLLIADDVGIGKTIEAGLIARELLDRGEIQRMAVICPAHLCDQWQAELKSKFDIDAVVVRPGTVNKLQRSLDKDQSVFRAYPSVIVSIDYIKSPARRYEFLTDCPEFVIVDEAHTSAAGGRMSGAQQQRHKLLQDLVNGASESSKTRHLILTTATPHSGNDEAFQSLLTLLDPEFGNLPAEDSLKADHPLLKKLSRHLVQRRRPDIKDYLNTDTPFPTRVSSEATWKMNREMASFYNDVLEFARKQVDRSSGLQRFQQRVSWWAALALMRSAISSPAAAIAALSTKVQVLEDADVVDAQGQRAVLDTDMEDAAEIDDVVPGADTTELTSSETERRKIRELIQQAESLSGKSDSKLQGVIKIVGGLLKDGYRPIVFCRYIATAEYVAEHLRAAFKDVEVQAVTGNLPPEERKQRVVDLGEHPQRILVATDCLSEGINLQEQFDAIIHYDLAWNPTRHEQREGRVDRFGQERSEVRTIMFFGEDNPVDRAVMDVLIRKADTIRQRLGVAVSVPQRSGEIMDSVFEAIFHGRGTAHQLKLGMGDEADKELEQKKAALESEWQKVEDRTRRSKFAQSSIHPESVMREMDEVRASIGSVETVERFVTAVSSRLNSPLVERNGRTMLPLSGMPQSVRSIIPGSASIPVDFDLPVAEGHYHLGRTSDVVEALATIAIDGALDANLEHRPARRSGAMLTDQVDIETTIAVVRLRIHLNTAGRTGRQEMLVEESLLVGWRWEGDVLVPIDEDEMTRLIDAKPTDSINENHRIRTVKRAIADEPEWRPLVDARAQERAREVLDAHRRVRDAAQIRGAGQLSAEPMLPVDILGLFVYLPNQ